MNRLAPLLLLAFAGCASAGTLDDWGRRCIGTTDRAERLEMVERLMRSGDEACIPVLIDCLESMKARGKGPDRVYDAAFMQPNVTAPPETWALVTITGMDFDLDIPKWRAWYDRVRGRLTWDGGPRRFIVR